MALWEERERCRLEILSRVDEAEASIARGEGIPITEESMRRHATDVKQRGRERLAAENAASRCWRISSPRKPRPNWMNSGCISPVKAAAFNGRIVSWTP